MIAMSNEEKILSILEKHDAMFEKQSAMLESLIVDVGALKQGQVKLEAGQAQLATDVTDIKLIIENELRPNIKLLAEGHGYLVEKIDYIQPLVEAINEDVKVIEAIVTDPSKEMIAIK